MCERKHGKIQFWFFIILPYAVNAQPQKKDNCPSLNVRSIEIPVFNIADKTGTSYGFKRADGKTDKSISVTMPNLTWSSPSSAPTVVKFDGPTASMGNPTDSDVTFSPSVVIGSFSLADADGNKSFKVTPKIGLDNWRLTISLDINVAFKRTKDASHILEPDKHEVLKHFSASALGVTLAKGNGTYQSPYFDASGYFIPGIWKGWQYQATSTAKFTPLSTSSGKVTSEIGYDFSLKFRPFFMPTIPKIKPVCQKPEEPKTPDFPSPVIPGIKVPTIKIKWSDGIIVQIPVNELPDQLFTVALDYLRNIGVALFCSPTRKAALSRRAKSENGFISSTLKHSYVPPKQYPNGIFVPPRVLRQQHVSLDDPYYNEQDILNTNLRYEKLFVNGLLMDHGEVRHFEDWTADPTSSHGYLMELNAWGVVYEGSVNAKGQKDGTGKFIYNSTRYGVYMYDGKLFQGQMQGLGRMNFVDGRMYEGDFQTGSYTMMPPYPVPKADGKIFYSSGALYHGRTVDSDSWERVRTIQPDGEGKFAWGDGSYYQGQVSHGLAHGFGRKILANGSQYEGRWHNGELIAGGISIYAGEDGARDYRIRALRRISHTECYIEKGTTGILRDGKVRWDYFWWSTSNMWACSLYERNILKMSCCETFAALSFDNDFVLYNSGDRFLPKSKDGRTILTPMDPTTWRIGAGNGIPYYMSKNMDDRERRVEMLDAVVHGEDEGDWIRVQVNDVTPSPAPTPAPDPTPTYAIGERVQYRDSGRKWKFGYVFALVPQLQVTFDDDPASDIAITFDEVRKATAVGTQCAPNFRFCYKTTYCVIDECKSGGCEWSQGVNYIDGVDNVGSGCTADFEARAKVGQIVFVRDTEATSYRCSHLIGRSVRVIDDDDTEDYPYAVEGCDEYLRVQDVGSCEARTACGDVSFAFIDTTGSNVALQQIAGKLQVYVRGHGHVGLWSGFDPSTGVYDAGDHHGVVPAHRVGALQVFLQAPGLQTCSSIQVTEENFLAAPVTGYENESKNYTCLEEFLTVFGTITCEVGGLWSKSYNLCVSRNKTCPTMHATSENHLAAPISGHVTDRLNYTCSAGWVKKFDSPLLCEISGAWEFTDMDLCIHEGLHCPTIEATDSNHLVAPISGSVNQIKSFACRSGWRKKPSVILTCLVGGTWSFPIDLLCVPDVKTCPTIAAAPENHLAADISGSVGDTVDFTCNSGWTKKPSVILTCQVGGTWSFPIDLLCVPDVKTCPKIAAAPENHLAADISGSIGDTVDFTCSSGWTKKPSVILTCQVGGTWSFPIDLLCVPGSMGIFLGQLPDAYKPELIFT